jgi:hypothetical protein
MKDDPYFQRIKNFYGSRKANRSGVLYINHIYEGLIILDRIGASLEAKQGFCMHPILQCDQDFSEQAKYVTGDPYIIVLTIEYRSVANEYLSKRKITHDCEVRLSPLKDVNDMLIADKVQNYKDFNLFHRTTHDRSFELINYFSTWLRVLGISEIQYLELINNLDQERKNLFEQ